LHAALPEKNAHGLSPHEVISAETLKKELVDRKNLLLLDARNKAAYDTLHIEGAKLPRPAGYYRQEELFKNGVVPEAPDPDKAVRQWASAIPKNQPIVTYCNTDCHASATLVIRLKQLGFTDVRSMEEGMQAWEKKGYPVSRA
jgi:rhodanese-related sulfurtransferase